MSKLKKIVTNLHESSKRNYIERMVSQKAKCMDIAKKYSFDYWDGNRKYGYGGYKYIPGRWKKAAHKIIKDYSLKDGSKILDIGCGKGYLLYEIFLINPNIELYGFDISSHGIRSVPKEIKKNIIKHNIKKKFPYSSKKFDLAISLGTLHNLNLIELKTSITEINRVSKKNYVMVESYRNNLELFNLQCWALTCDSFFTPNEWKWIFKLYGYNGDFEFIYFK